VSIRRDRVVADGLHEDLIVENHGADRRSVTLELEVAADLLRFQLQLAPHERWRACIDVTCQVDWEQRPPRRRCGELGRLHPDMALSLEEWLDRAPRLETDVDPLRHTYRHTLTDLAALRFRPSADLEWSVPAAELPLVLTPPSRRQPG
jgi:hypothetical protein